MARCGEFLKYELLIDLDERTTELGRCGGTCKECTRFVDNAAASILVSLRFFFAPSYERTAICVVARTSNIWLSDRFDKNGIETEFCRRAV